MKFWSAGALLGPEWNGHQDCHFHPCEIWNLKKKNQKKTDFWGLMTSPPITCSNVESVGESDFMKYAVDRRRTFRRPSLHLTHWIGLELVHYWVANMLCLSAKIKMSDGGGGMFFRQGCATFECSLLIRTADLQTSEQNKTPARLNFFWFTTGGSMAFAEN